MLINYRKGVETNYNISVSAIKLHVMCGQLSALNISQFACITLLTLSSSALSKFSKYIHMSHDHTASD